jgi:TM2 domain-containing membrane protein YozV
MFCPKCGKESAGSPVFCSGCGARLVEEANISPKSRVAASLFAWPGFLGQFGAHRFYTGKFGTAAVMLALGILGYATIWIFGLGLVFLIPVWIWSLIDFIFAVSGSMIDDQGRAIKNW